MKTNNVIERTIIGNIFPVKKDQDGKVIRVLIDSSDQDQDQYFITNNKIGNELLDLVNHKVQVTGYVNENDNGDLMFNVRSYKTINDSNGDNNTDE